MNICIYRALLNLVGLHFRFGHMALALQALEESVRLAQHASDHKCLANALYWLVRLVSVAGERELEGQLVRRCLQRACQLRLTKLQGLAVMRLVRHRLHSTQRKDNALGKPSSDAGAVGTCPTLVWDALAAAHSLMLESGGGEDELCWSLNLLQSTVWGVFGHLQLSVAHSSLPQALPFTTTAVDNACLAFCSKVYHQHAHQDPQAALRQLLSVRDVFPRTQLYLWCQSAMMMLHTRSLHRRQLQRAQELAWQMGAMLVPAEDASAFVIAERARANTLLCTGDPVRAVNVLQRLRGWCLARKLPLEALLALLALAVSHVQVSAMGAALPLVLACVSTAQQLNMDTVLASGVLALGSLHLRRGLPEKAHRLVLSVLPLLLSSGRIEERAQAYLLCAKCELEKACSISPHDSPQVFFWGGRGGGGANSPHNSPQVCMCLVRGGGGGRAFTSLDDAYMSITCFM